MYKTFISQAALIRGPICAGFQGVGFRTLLMFRTPLRQDYSGHGAPASAGTPTVQYRTTHCRFMEPRAFVSPMIGRVHTVSCVRVAWERQTSGIRAVSFFHE